MQSRRALQLDRFRSIATGRLLVPSLLLLGLLAPQLVRAASFQSRWDRAPDRIWVGASYWANPMEDWRVEAGRLQCLHAAGNRNVHVLTHQLVDNGAGFRMSVRFGLLQRGEAGSAGFRIGIHDPINDYRGNAIWGSGIDAGIRMDGRLQLGEATAPLGETSFEDIRLTLTAEPSGAQMRLTLAATDLMSGQSLGQVQTELAAAQLVGNLALVNNLRANVQNGSRFWFRDWHIEGDRVEAHDDRTFGPILWAMHTVSDSRGEEGFVLKMSAHLPPLGPDDSRDVHLQVQQEGTWKTVASSQVDEDAWTAILRVPHWPVDHDVPYRLVYHLAGREESSTEHVYAGTIRKNPLDQPLVLGGLTCQFHTGFPYQPVVQNLEQLDPDLLYFSGDQLYENSGHYGIIRRPADRAILNYLRKFYMFGWAFGDLMRDRPTVCLPDDHDVFQGNLWGEGGAPMKGQNTSSRGGYIEPVRMVQTVHRTTCGHHPDFYDPRPAKQGMSVYYGDLVYGRVSFAIIADRQFKSGPEHVATGPGRPDHVTDPQVDIQTLDRPGLVLLGERQLDFLAHWVTDWRGADMKVLLSETTFCNVATHHGAFDHYLIADLDSGGWPPSARNTAVRLIRKCFPLHINGDQHLTSLVQYGVDQPRDSNWSFCTPAVSVGYQRWWRPDEVQRPHSQRPAHGLPHTGQYTDGFGNPIYVYAVGNPEGSRHPNRYRQAHIKASGFGIIRVDRQQRTYTCEAYRFLIDATDGKPTNQFPGFPYTIRQLDNYGRAAVAWLPRLQIEGADSPVVQVIREETGELVYTLRIQGASFRPKVFAAGRYTVRVGAENDRMQSWTGIESVAEDDERMMTLELDDR